MRRCLQLASSAIGKVSPNPMVGSVLVHDGRIIGEGFHQAYGEAHAEVNCLNRVAEGDKHLISNSILYISLEPCNHYGKTPPCTDLILRSGVPVVVVGCRDHSEKVNGAGIRRLRDAGVTVIEGVLANEAEQLNRRFFIYNKFKRPFIILKWAESADGFLGNAESRTKISNVVVDRLVHKWRTEESAIMIATNTALVDNPALTARYWTGSNPVRVLIDKDLRIPETNQIYNNDAKTLVFNLHKADVKNHITYIRYQEGGSLLSFIMHSLYEHQVQSIIIEGGAQLLSSFVNAGYWDEARLIVNNKLYLSDGVQGPVFDRTTFGQRKEVGDNSLLFYRNNQF